MEEMNIITITDAETQEKVELELVEDLTIDDVRYVILAPIDEDTEDAYIYKVVKQGKDESYEAVEDEEEFNKVVAEYDKIFEAEMGK